MKISQNWLSDLVDLSPLKGDSQALADLLTSRGLEVDAIDDQAAGLENVVSARIEKKRPHPGADRLSLCEVTIDGKSTQEIVCGAKNMDAGDCVALAQVGAKLPNGVLIKQSKIRGVESSGMLCSETELGLGSESDGILILPKSTSLGEPIAKVLGRDDSILEISVTPNRGDCLSHWGIAREVAAGLGVSLREPDISLLERGNCSFETRLEDSDQGGLQFLGCTVEGVKIGPSPEWVVQRLESLGSRSINNVVDATNLAMFEWGHPMHAYDADRLQSKVMSIRTAEKDESLPLLDSTEVQLKGSELVIFDGKRSVALAGVMGGGNSEVSDGTTNLFLECAEFSPIRVRRSASLHGKHTDSSHRFERGIDPDGARRAISRLAQFILEWAGGAVSGLTAATDSSRSIEEGSSPRQIDVQPSFFSSLLGCEVSETEARKALNALGCEVSGSHELWSVKVPSYRRDLTLREDLVEEVARTIGYDRIPSTIPSLTSAPTASLGDEALLRLESLDRARDILAHLGLMETVHYSFCSRALLAEFGLESTVPVLNPLSEEQEVMVPSLLPGLLETASKNENHHFGSEPLQIRFFELRPTFSAKKVEAVSKRETGVEETWKLAFVLAGTRLASSFKTEEKEVDYYDLKSVVERFFEQMGTRGVRMRSFRESGKKSGKEPAHSHSSYSSRLFHPGYSVEIWVGKERVGAMGLAHPRVSKKMKFRGPVFYGEIDWEPVYQLSRKHSESKTFRNWPEYPPIERDFSLIVRKEIKAEQITQLALKTGRPLAKVVKVFDTYCGSQVAEGMTSVSVRVIFLDEGRSLKESEADQVSSQILAGWKKSLGAELRT